MNEWRGNALYAKYFIIAVAIMIVLDVANFIFGYQQYELFSLAANGGDFSEAELEESTGVSMKIAGIFTIVNLVSAVLFILWFKGAYRNLSRYKPLAYSEKWTIWCWFVPFVNLVVPCQIMLDLFRKTREYLDEKGLSDRVALNTKIVGWWWALWITQNVIASVSVHVALEQYPSWNDRVTLSQLSLLLDVIAIVIATVTIKMVKSYANTERLLNDD
jgi:heme/copper-type cytochrome/quinol oxidase subunit 2